MKNEIKFIAKWEGGKNGNPILFFPEYSVNRGRIACYVRMGEHGESCTGYYKRLRNPRTMAQRSEVQSLVMLYQRQKCEPNEKLVRAWRDTSKMRKAREL